MGVKEPRYGAKAYMADDTQAEEIAERVEDARLLWRHERRTGAFLVALLAVAARAKHDYPDVRGERARFVRFIKDRYRPRISIEYRGKLLPLEDVFYQLFRNSLVHEGGLTSDVGFLESSDTSVRAGGAPNYRLLISYGWFDQLIEWASRP